MRDFVIVFGPPAAGKMTVGLELARRAGFKLFHGHQSIELAISLFDYGTPEFSRLNGRIRTDVFEVVAASSLRGFIFTFAWAFELPSEKAYIDRLVAQFAANGARASFVELEASLETRIARNGEPSRLAAKPSKQDVVKSTAELIRTSTTHRLNTTPEEPFYYPDRYIKIDTAALAPTEAAQRICDHLGFEAGS